MCFFRVSVVTLVASSLLAACGGGNTQNDAPGEGSFGFVVIGDTPYDDEDTAMLANAIPMAKASRTPFVVHLGDYKGGSAPCTEDHDDAFAALVESLDPIPVFYTPGDNEWTDCDRNINEETQQPYSDLYRLSKIRNRFFSSPVQAPPDMQYRQQDEVIENATWTYAGVRFATLHVVGTNNGRNWVVGDSLQRALQAVEAREAANLDWLEATFRTARSEGARAVIIAMQADPTQVLKRDHGKPCDTVKEGGKEGCDAYVEMRKFLRNEALDFDGPVLVMHGDTAPFTLNQSFIAEDAPNLWRFNAAGDAGIGRTGQPYGTRDIAFVTVDPGAGEPFSAVGLLTGKTAK